MCFLKSAPSRVSEPKELQSDPKVIQQWEQSKTILRNTLLEFTVILIKIFKHFGLFGWKEFFVFLVLT